MNYLIELPVCTFDNSVCTLENNSKLVKDTYCIDSSKQIYVGTESTTGKCTKQTESLYYFSMDYKAAATPGTTTPVMIYAENGSNTYEQYVSRSLLQSRTYMYNCNDSGSCTLVTSFNYKTLPGYFLTGVSTSKKLITCTSDAIADCTQNDTPKNGLYLNYGADKTVNPIISCTGSNCDIVEITKTACTGKGDNVQVEGGLIMDGGKPKMCVGDGEAVEIFASSSTSATPKYKSYKTAGATVNVKFTTDGRVYELENDNLSLLSSSTANDCSYQHYYIKSGDKKIYTAAEGVTTCTVIGSNLISSLTGSGTEYGYLYFKSDGTRITDLTNQIDLIYYCKFENSANTKCTRVINTYFYDSIAQKVVYCSGWKGEGCVAIATTSASTCSSDDEGKIIYNSNKVKICFGGTAVDLPAEGEKSYVAFTPATTLQTYGIEKGKRTLLELTSNSATIYNEKLDDTQRYYFINYSIDANKKALYRCIGESSIEACTEREPLKGYYINGGRGDTNSIIKCSSATECEYDTPITGETATCVIGKVLYSNYKFFICKDGESTTNGSGEIEFDNTSYTTLTIAANNFPSITAASTVNVKVDVGKAVIMEEASLPACSSTIPSTGACVTGAESGQYCIHTTSKKIYQTNKKGNCVPIEGTSPIEYFFFDREARRVPILRSTRNVVPYECSYTTDDSGKYTLDTCTVFKGLLYTSMNIINCNGWKDEGCILKTLPSSSECNKGMFGEITNDNKICFKGNKISLGYNEIYMILEEANSVFGVGKGLLTLSLTERTVKVVSGPPAGTAVKYFVDSSTNKLIKCTGNTCAYEASPETSPKVYIDGANTVYSLIICSIQNNQANGDQAGDQAGDQDIDQSQSGRKRQDQSPQANEDQAGDQAEGDEEPEIICNSFMSISIDNPERYGYIDATVKSSDKFTNVITCNWNNGCVSAAGKTDGHVYVDGTDKTNNVYSKIIVCTTSGCESKEGVNNINAGVYLDAVDASKVIKCDASGKYKCISKNGIRSQGYAYIDINKKSGDNYPNIITCQTGTCVSSVAKASTYYIDADVFGNEINKIIECDGTTCASESIAFTTHVHMRYVDGTAESSNSIYCFPTTGCISIQTITPCKEEITTSNSEFCKYKNIKGEDTELPKGNYCWSTDGKLYYSVVEESTNKCKAFNKAEGSETIILERESTAPNLYHEGKMGYAFGHVLMECDATKCELYLDTNVLLESDKSKFLYKCDAFANCYQSTHIPSPGYYVYGMPTKAADFVLTYTELMYCKNTEISDCVYYTDSDAEGEVDILPDTGNTYYIDRGNPGHVITCTGGGCTTNKVMKKSYGFLDEEQKSEEIYPNVITCDKNVCTSENKVEIIKNNKNLNNLYFIDFDSDSDNIIKCDSSTCKYESASGKYIDGTDANSTISGRNSTPECRVNTGVGCKDKTYYLTDDKYIINGSSANKLFYCAKSGVKCSEVTNIPGYYVNEAIKEYYQCITGGTCSKLITSTNTCGKSGDNGKIFIDNNMKLAVCLDYRGSKSVPFNSLNSNYVLYEGTAGYPFTIVKVNENSIVHDLEFNFTQNYFIYIDQITNEILQEGGCPDGCYDPTYDYDLILEYVCDNPDEVATCKSVSWNSNFIEQIWDKRGETKGDTTWETWNNNRDKVTVTQLETDTGYRVVISYDSSIMERNESTNNYMKTTYGTALYGVTTIHLLNGKNDISVTEDGENDNSFLSSSATEVHGTNAFHNWWIFKCSDETELDKNGVEREFVFTKNSKDTKVILIYEDRNEF